MSQVYYELYVDDTVRLAKTLVVKAEANAVALNAYVSARGYNVDPVDPLSWKYYMNMAGDYHPSDTMMRVRSLDTLELIDFTKANLEIHRTTKREYAFGTTFYNELALKYQDKNQEQLILGILNPVDITLDVIDSEDGEILWYDKSLVESNETNLIPDLEAWIKKIYGRWYNAFYPEIDDLYDAYHQGTIFAFIPSTILNIRLANCKTQRVHTYHIREYLASHNRLDAFIDNMTKRQQLYFYRNILYLHRNAGKQEIHDELVGKVMTDRGLPLAQWDIRHNLEFQPEEINPVAELYRTPVNLGIAAAGADVRSVARMLLAEDPLAKDNTKIRAQAEITITEQIQTSRFNELPTKILESSVIDMTDATPYSLSDALLNHWMFWSHSARYETFLAIRDPKTGTNVRMSNKSAFLLWIYSINKAYGVTLEFLPKLEAWRVLRQPPPTMVELEAVVTPKYVNKATLESLYVKLPVLPDKIISPGTFYDTVYEIHEHTMHERDVWASQENFMSRGMVEGAAQLFYYDVPLDFGSDIRYDDWLVDHNLDAAMAEFSTLELETLAYNILRAATGVDAIGVKSLKEMQTAMLRLFARLSSYSIQFLQEINDSALRMLDWVDIRLGDDATIAGDSTFVGVIPVSVIEVDVLSRHRVDYDMVGDLVNIEVDTQMLDGVDVDLTVDFSGSGDTTFVYQADMAPVQVEIARCNKYVVPEVVKERIFSGYRTGKTFSEQGYTEFPVHYLRQTPEEALMLQLNTANDTFIYAHNCKITHTGSVVPGQAKVFIEAHAPRSMAEIEIYSGSVEVFIDLLSLSDYFAGTTLTWDWPSRPLNTYELVDWLSKLTGFSLKHEEFILEDVPRNALKFSLKGAQKALRWTGAVEINIPPASFFAAQDKTVLK